MLQIVDIATVNSFRKFTLNSGYGSGNTMFVRVSDGYSVGADPIPVKKGNRITTHHIKYEGYLYGLRKGYVMATQKDGYQGWTDAVEIAPNMYRVFNPFIGVKPTLEVENGVLTIYVGHKGKYPLKPLGTFATIFGEVTVHANIFNGLKRLLRLLRQLPEWATEHVNNVSYNADFTKKYNLGEVTIGQFEPLESFDLSTVEYCVVDESNTMVKVDGRYLVFQNSEYCHQDCRFLNGQGILTLAPASGHSEGSAEIPANSEYETTEYQWNKYTADKEIKTGRVLLTQLPTRELHPVEIALINLPQGEINDYTVMQYIKQSLGLGEASNGGMRDMFKGLTEYGQTSMHENVKSVYFSLLRLARKTTSKSAQMLCNLMHMPYHTDCLKWDYHFESDRMLGTFLNACIRNGKDMEQLWMDATALTPQSMTDWINSNLVYWIEDRHVGHNFYNNAAWAERRNYQGRIVYIFAENASCAQYKPVEVSEEEYGIYVVRLAAERAYKARYDAVPANVVNKHLYIQQQDNPNQFPKATGKGKLSGCKNMGSCQCGDVDWWISYDCDTLEFSYGNSNWSNRGDYHIPYVGNALEMVVKATNITEGWKNV